MHGERREALLARVPLLAKWSGRMIQIKSAQEIERMRASGLVTAGAHAAMKAALRPGITTGELDAIAEDRHGVRQSIIARMERHGGSARVRRMSTGTEVALTLPERAH